MGLLELTALPRIARDKWTSWVRDANVLLANGGDAVFLTHWIRQSGLADLLPSLHDNVWMGLSAGSMALTPRVGEDFVETKPSITGDDKGLGVVGFSIFPHLDFPEFPENSMANAERWAAGLGNPSYAIDDLRAIQVVDGKVEVIPEGNWRYFGAVIGGWGLRRTSANWPEAARRGPPRRRATRAGRLNSLAVVNE